MPDKILGTRSENTGRRLQEVAPGEFAEEVYVREAWSAGIANGRAYLLSTGQLALALAGNINVLIRNPTDSGVAVTILGGVAFGTVTGWATVRFDPTSGLPTTAQTTSRVNRAVASTASVEILAEASATASLDGGEVGPVIGVGANIRTEIEPLGIVLAPGQSVGIGSQFGAAANLAVTVYVVEEPI